MEQLIQLNSNVKFSEHFTIGEFTKSGSHPEVYNIPSHEARANLKRLCGWLEVLRKRYNAKYCLSSRLSEAHGEISGDPSTTLGMTKEPTLDMTNEEPIRINSGYRSPQLNRKIGEAANSNHLTGCAADIKVSGMDQALRYATILLDYADESKHEFDELLIEKNRYGAMWLHFAVRPKDNRRKILFINA